VLAVASALSHPTVSAAGAPTSPPIATRAAAPTRLPAGAPLRTAVLTPDGFDRYEYSGNASSTVVTVRAPRTNRSGNLRTVFWPADAPVRADGTSCATWRAASGEIVQPGAALRIAPGRSGGVVALTVTKNVMFGADWGFNVHIWDSGRGTSRALGIFDLREEFRRRPFPWRLCARTLGDRLEFKVWPLAEQPPPWGDARHGGSLTLPADAPRAGRAGWYAGHLQPGMAVSFAELGGDPDGAGPLSVAANGDVPKAR
jgi:hypothetical protein